MRLEDERENGQIKRIFLWAAMVGALEMLVLAVVFAKLFLALAGGGLMILLVGELRMMGNGQRRWRE